MLEGLAHLLGVKVQTLVASVLGAMTSLLFNRGAIWARRLGLVAGGSCIAFYAAEPTILWLGMASRYESLAGFLIGLFGMSLVDAVMRAIGQADLWGIARGWIERRKQ